MFSKRVTRGVNTSSASGNNELRRRHGQGLNTEPKYQAASPYPEIPQPPQDSAENSRQLHKQRVKHSKSRQESAVQIEKTVAEVYFSLLDLPPHLSARVQMGKLFSKMSELVMAQGETITRIEDDVEFGLTETQEAHKSMEYFYEITKGNRSLIFKIFGLLIFFIFLFLYFI
jgi:syntaxin 5